MMADFAYEVLRRCGQRGARIAEVFIKKGTTRTVSLETGGAVCWTRTAEGGIALRVLRDDGSAGFSSCCGMRDDTGIADRLVEAALDAARFPSSGLDLPEGPAADGRGLGLFDPRLNSATPADLEGMLDEAATEALRTDSRVRQLDSASIAASTSEIRLLNSRGFDGGYRQTLVHVSLGVAAGDTGASVVLRRSRTARSLSAFSAALFGDETARLAAIALEGRPAPTGAHPALLAPAAAAELLRQASRDLTPPGPRPGEAYGSRHMTIIDDGRLPGGIASAPFDGEGTPTRRTPVVSKGLFGQMLHDISSASRCSAESTGNGGRSSFRDPPRRLPSNLFIAPGSDDPRDLLAGMDRGLWVLSLRPTAAVLSDDRAFAAFATGHWVEKGRPSRAVAGTLVTGRLDDLLAGIAGVGNDLTFGFPAGSFGTPSLLVEPVELRNP